jgi:hypothetical protein
MCIAMVGHLAHLQHPAKPRSDIPLNTSPHINVSFKHINNIALAISFRPFLHQDHIIVKCRTASRAGLYTCDTL